MEDEKIYISQNIKRLMELRGIPSLTQLADKCAGQLTPRTLGGMVNYPKENNPTLEKLQVVARALRVQVYMLLIKDFPFEELKPNKYLDTISPAGYRLLALFEQSPINVKTSILDYSAYQFDAKTGSTQRINDLSLNYSVSKK